MREDTSISRYRDKLDHTLSSPDLTNAETLRGLVKDQIMRSSVMENEDYFDQILETRTKEVSNFLGMLRSASVDDVAEPQNSRVSRGGWKVKQDTEEFRVMYREGPEGTPLHTLLVEGYVDGPTDVCLCISWEAGLYPKWWPQIMVPTFKIVSSDCLQKVRIGEQICLVRMKLSWPLSTREALVHYFEFEYIQDGLVIVLLNSISDLESINKSTHGFSRDGIPDPQDVIRIDVVGGFAIQKVSTTRSYFRTIANMDIKLDFVPPSLINFVSRQLVGSGFKLYKKEVASVSKGDEDFGKALKDPLYTRIREALYSNSLPTVGPQLEEQKHDTSFLLEEESRRTLEGSSSQEIVHDDDLSAHSEAGELFLQDKKPHIEIEEVKESDSEESISLAANGDKSGSLQVNEINTRTFADSPRITIRPEVEKALTLLDEVISIFQEYRSNDETKFMHSPPVIAGEESPNLDKIAFTESVASEPDKIWKTVNVSAQPRKSVESEVIASNESRRSSASHGSRRTGSTIYSREANHNKIAPASPDEDTTSTHATHHNNALHLSENHVTELSLHEKIAKEENVIAVDANSFDGNKGGKSKSRKPHFLCCFGFMEMAAVS
ncbi:OLC1v1034014C1 [Oldenlandia corymbosa var. corymbosa]|uniref:OLC1v1034014C1 n=1 Tax=Oldenlandia corymbosa var. corymbosa TaxID=529605 RepID=A0AAV1CPP7_OLDCO|nr:OLC1v1034014C1 [Oldenlandia corymbosa var. corymbosa]